MANWRHIGTCVDGQRFEIDGLDVWSHEWNEYPGLRARVLDPRYGQQFNFRVYEMVGHVGADERKVTFAAGEFSNCVWGFYLVDEPLGESSAYD
jgi:hypothetical protein